MKVLEASAKATVIIQANHIYEERHTSRARVRNIHRTQENSRSKHAHGSLRTKSRLTQAASNSKNRPRNWTWAERVSTARKIPHTGRQHRNQHQAASPQRQVEVNGGDCASAVQPQEQSQPTESIPLPIMRPGVRQTSTTERTTHPQCQEAQWTSGDPAARVRHRWARTFPKLVARTYAARTTSRGRRFPISHKADRHPNHNAGKHAAIGLWMGSHRSSTPSGPDGTPSTPSQHLKGSSVGNLGSSPS